MRLSVSQCKPSAQSAMLPAFSVLPSSCSESAGSGNCQDREGELDARIGSLTTQGLSGSGAEHAFG